jgi:hypothetical protein
MTEGEFFAGITGHNSDLKQAVAALTASGQPFCLIGGLAVNNYAEPVATLDADFAVAGSTGLSAALRAAGFAIAEFPHSINATLPGSRLRLQITINSRYADFPKRAVPGVVFDVPMPVASLDDIVLGKLWAFTDSQRRASKRAKDRADLIRLCEVHPTLVGKIPVGLIPEIDEMR